MMADEWKSMVLSRTQPKRLLCVAVESLLPSPQKQAEAPAMGKTTTVLERCSSAVGGHSSLLAVELKAGERKKKPAEGMGRE